jgi:hypothetical protein
MPLCAARRPAAILWEQKLSLSVFVSQKWQRGEMTPNLDSAYPARQTKQLCGATQVAHEKKPALQTDSRANF